jgi:hypothetical protein
MPVEKQVLEMKCSEAIVDGNGFRERKKFKKCQGPVDSVKALKEDGRWQLGVIDTALHKKRFFNIDMDDIHPEIEINNLNNKVVLIRCEK